MHQCVFAFCIHWYGGRDGWCHANIAFMHSFMHFFPFLSTSADISVL